jgi:hypothetical protein
LVLPGELQADLKGRLKAEKPGTYLVAASLFYIAGGKWGE